jgi:hypothetical protein
VPLREGPIFGQMRSRNRRREGGLEAFFDSEVFSGLVSGIIASCATIAALYTRDALQNSRDRRLSQSEKVILATRAATELLTLTRHNKANVLVIEKMKLARNFGQAVDLEKMRFGEKGLLAIDLSKAAEFPSQLAQDVLRMQIFLRNNELEISAAIRLIFTESNRSDEQKWSLIQKLQDRFLATLKTADSIRKNLSRTAIRQIGSPTAAWSGPMTRSRSLSI